MSVAGVVARVAELQSLLAPATVPSPPASTAGASGFAARLASASASPAASPPIVTADGGFGAGATARARYASGPSSLLPGVPYRDEITAAAERHGLDPALLAGLIRQESGFNPRAGSPAGAQGLAQLMPATAAGLGVRDPFDPAQSIEGGATYLAAQLHRFGGDVARGLAAYNAGPNAVERFGGVPPYAETQAYVRRVQAFAAAYGSGTSAAAA